MSKRLRVLLVIDHFGPGGAQRQLAALACGLHARGHDVEVFVYQPDFLQMAAPVIEAGVSVHGYRKRSRFSPGVILHLRRVVRSHRPDVVVSFMPVPNLYALLAAVGQRTKVVVSERSSVAGSTSSLHRLVLHSYRLADRVVTNSHHQRVWLSERYPWMAGRVETVLNGVDFDQFRPTQRSGRTAGSTTLLALGRVGPEKNALRLARAVAALRSDGHDVRVRWAGEPDALPEGLAYKEAVASEIERLGLGHAWQWLGFREDVPALLEDHDALVHPSLFEGLPNSVCEALTAGRPVLVSNVCDHPRLVQQGITGFLFDPMSEESIADAIRRFVMLGSDARERMGRQAREFAERELAMAGFIGRFDTLLREITDPSSLVRKRLDSSQLNSSHGAT